MPVILPLEALDFWLDCANVEAVTAAALLTAPREDFFEACEISTAVNRPISNTSQVHTHHAGDRGSSDECACQTREEAQER
jgi:putative SOS response-associated peptidase YedK